MSVTDDAFWEEMYNDYVSDYIEEDFSFEDKQGLVSGEGSARSKLKDSIFNRIVDAAKDPYNQKFGYFRDANRHGLVLKKDKMASIAQTKLEDAVGKEEKVRVEKAVKERRTSKGVQQAIQAIKVVTGVGRREEETARAASFRQEGNLAQSFISTIRREVGSPSEIDAVVRQARSEISGERLARVERAAEEVKQRGQVFEVE